MVETYLCKIVCDTPIARINRVNVGFAIRVVLGLGDRAGGGVLGGVRG